MEEIAIKDINKVEMSVVNEIGFLFEWRNRIFRAINDDANDRVKALFDFGLIDELVEENLFPKSWMTDYKLDGYDLIIEHTKIFPVTYPYEWSFSMLKDAAITALKVNIIAKKYGYQTHDCHAFNVVFDGIQPKYVDLGSFVKIEDDFNGFIDYEGFLRSYYYPLKIYSDGNSYLAYSLLNPNGVLMPHESYLLYKYSFLRYIDISRIKKITDYYFIFRRLSSIKSAQIKKYAPGIVGTLICSFKDNNLLPLQSINLKSLVKKIKNIPTKQTNSQWGTYHNEYYTNEGEQKFTFRFNRIIEIINDADIRTFVELGGNQGVLSKLLIKHTNLEYAVCTDYDKDAVESMYLSAKDENISLNPVLLDCMFPIVGSTSNPPWERFKSDIVIALALTHHLLLSQNFRIDFVLERMSRYTKKYILIEFMPLGLWDGKSAPPVPEWYTIDWFRDSLKLYFDIILEEQLEENRTLFFGKLLTNPDSNSILHIDEE